MAAKKNFRVFSSFIKKIYKNNIINQKAVPKNLRKISTAEVTILVSFKTYLKIVTIFTSITFAIFLIKQLKLHHCITMETPIIFHPSEISI